ncbi:hypothetical protein ACLMJK_008811 [Lecanora helva]
MSTVSDIPPVPKLEPFDEESFSESSPEPEEQSLTQEPAQVQKRKGGRKPIYATSEERKQRNRQAQAAFRERRTEYIKQLESTIKQHEEALQSLQQNHRAAADECLMLRYKNSLLERILLEKGSALVLTKWRRWWLTVGKGIDVQAELKSKTEGSHVVPQSQNPTGAPMPTPIQRAVMNRQSQVRRSTSGSQGSRILKPHTAHPTSNRSPQLQPTPPHTISPSTVKSPTGMPKGGIISPNVDVKAQQHPQQHQPLDRRNYPQQPPSRLSVPATRPSMQNMTPSTVDGSRGSEVEGATGSHSTFYPSTFQAHIEQLGKLPRLFRFPGTLFVLEQEYDAHADMLDDENPDDGSAGPGPYPQNFQQPPLPPGQQISMGMQGQPPMHNMQSVQPMPPMSSMQPPQTSQNMDSDHPAYANMGQGFDPYDPMLDADPFGLTASMHFPTQFTFQESSMRR